MTEKIGRNDLCPCGSGKKYKVCCLKKQKPRPLGSRRFKATVLNSKTPPQQEAAAAVEVEDEGLDLIARVHGTMTEGESHSSEPESIEEENPPK